MAESYNTNQYGFHEMVGVILIIPDKIIYKRDREEGVISGIIFVSSKL